MAAAFGDHQRIAVFGSAYSGKINSWFSTIRNRPDLYSGTNTTRGYNGLKADPRRALRPRHQVLRRGQLPGVHEGRRRARWRDRQRPGPRLGRPLPGHRRPARAGLHPERHPAHGRPAGAPLRAVTPFVERLRPRPAPAAALALAPRAGRPAGPHPAPDGPRDRAEVRRPHGHPGRASSTTCWASRPRSTRRTSARTSSRRRSTRPSSPTARAATSSSRTSRRSALRSRTRSTPTPRTRPSARSSPARAPTSGS